ncbi:MAG: ABC transporter ATP-binding protein [Candidatus Cloacimonetes bacterium HGW-Cloacimonetes-1]|nr:MAG: ABC transporter ATP-binding protein [Candidatus Cloacimonetes bacterium HGW-Cloacimonetes-1]
MSLIQVNSVSIEFGGNYILRDISCTVAKNSRIGMIGPNGCGKSTLIKIILSMLTPTEGTIAIAKRCEIAYLPQNMKLDPGLIMIDYIKDARKDIKGIWDAIDRLSSALHQKHEEETEKKLAIAIEQFHAIGGYEFENEVKFVLTSLNFPPDTWEKRIGDFSGGEQTRICLAAILLKPFDVLILDEPTNHLDVSMISWLEKYLNKLDRPYLIVSHDRVFLDNTVTTIYNLDGGTLAITKGNFSSYKAAEEISLMSQERMYERHQKWIEETKDFIARNIGSQKTIQARSRQKMLDKTEIIKKPKNHRMLNLNIQNVDRSGNDVFVLEDVRFGIDEDFVLAEAVSLRAHYKDRICIVGPNGCGKTTLLKTLLDENEILDGYLKIGASLDIGYYDQHQFGLDESLTVMNTLWQIVPDATNGYILTWLARFGFRGDDVEKRVGILSGGEKSRLNLSVLIHQSPNLLILDEPTNHLDIDMTDALLTALQSYSGTIIFVSHDRYLMRELANKYWVFRKKLDRTRVFTTIEEIKDDLDTALELSFQIPEVPKPQAIQREKKRKINPWHLEQLQKQIDDQHDDLSTLNIQLNMIHDRLSNSETYANQNQVILLQDQMLETEQRIDKIKVQIHDLENKYLEMSYDD